MTLKLVITDVDGTLVQTDKSLSPGTIAAVARLQAAGIPVAVVSARPPRGLRWIIDTLDLKGPCAGFNGGSIVAPDDTILEWNPVPPEMARLALDLFKSRGVSAWLFTQNEWLAQDPDGPHVAHERHTVRFNERIVPDFTPYLDQVGKLCGVDDNPEKLAAVETELQSLLQGRASALRSQTYYLDVTHTDANKGHAVRALARLLDIDVAHVAVLGDMQNDVPMFKVAGFSVAMGNGTDAVKAAATATTAANDQDGWAQAADTLLLPRAAFLPAEWTGPRDITCVDPASVAEAAANWIVDHFGARPGRLAISLSGGSTPKLLYEALARPPFRDRMPWARTHFFWGDERFVPTDDPRSNTAMVRAAMLDHVPVPPENIHPMPTTGTPAEAAQLYEQHLRAFHGDDLAKPLFDLVLLGLGINGHTASLFPGEPAVTDRTAWAALVAPPGEPVRITLTFPPLESCHAAAFLVCGADKRDVVARVQANDPTLVASHYRPAGNLHWWLDAAASRYAPLYAGMGWSTP